MKNYFCLLVLILAIYAARAQGCLPQGITFSNQVQIDNFQTDYPNCTHILGNVTIDGNDITNLNGLGILTSVDGNLFIGLWPGSNPGLLNLAGLQGLTSIGGSLHILENVSLSGLNGLNNLVSIGNSLDINSNPLLSSTEVFENLNSIGGHLSISHQPLITDLTGFRNLNTVGGGIGISWTGIVNLEGLEHVTYLGGSLDLYTNTNLISLEGLDNLTVIGENLGISQNNSLMNLSALHNLASIGGFFYLDYNYSLSNLGGLENLTTIGGYLWIGSNYTLVNLAGLVNLTSVGGDFSILGNPVLSTLEGINNLASINGNLFIYWNMELTSLGGLANINPGSITNMDIHQNSKLSYCNIESICGYLAAPNGTVSIYQNAPGCNSPLEVATACEIVGNDEIASIRPLALFPNPSAAFITISVPGIFPHTTLTIVNLSGQEVLRQAIANPTTQLDIKFLPAGMYFVKVSDGKGIQAKKLIKY